MATILTTLQRSNNLPGSETSSEPELEPLPFDPRAVLPVRSTEGGD
jgi:hypothetical protein